jgi:urease accessory protein
MYWAPAPLILENIEGTDMILIKNTLGNINSDNELKKKYDVYLKNGKAEILSISSRDRKKNKMRKITDKGTELGLTIVDDNMLASGDVLVDDGERMIIVNIEKDEVMVIELNEEEDESRMIKKAVKIGHLLGNQHWGIIVNGRSIYVPIAIDKAVMETVIANGNLENINIRYEELDQSIMDSDQESIHAPHSH